MQLNKKKPSIPAELCCGRWSRFHIGRTPDPPDVKSGQASMLNRGRLWFFGSFVSSRRSRTRNEHREQKNEKRIAKHLLFNQKSKYIHPNFLILLYQTTDPNRGTIIRNKRMRYYFLINLSKKFSPVVSRDVPIKNDLWLYQHVICHWLID